jgi:hypothetical protein
MIRKDTQRSAQMTRRWTVLVDWTDGPVEDTDEVVVTAATPSAAVAAAKKAWRLTIGAEWPACKLTNVEIATSGTPPPPPPS